MTNLSCAPSVFLIAVRDAIRGQRIPSEIVQVRREAAIYERGQRDRSVYLVDSGEVKVIQSCRDGHECITALHGANDIFGELCLGADDARGDSAIARVDTRLRRIAAHELLTLIAREGLHGAFACQLTSRMAQQQHLITTLLTCNSEIRLAKILLMIAGRTNRRDPAGRLIASDLRHGELASMVGTTRTRIGVFLKKFREHGLIESGARSTLLISDDELRAFVERYGACDEIAGTARHALRGAAGVHGLGQVAVAL